MTGATPEETLLRCLRATPLEVVNAQHWAWTHQTTAEHILALVEQVRAEQVDMEALRTRPEDVTE